MTDRMWSTRESRAAWSRYHALLSEQLRGRGYSDEADLLTEVAGEDFEAAREVAWGQLNRAERRVITRTAPREPVPG